jgi:hypothetical protein
VMSHRLRADSIGRRSRARRRGRGRGCCSRACSSRTGRCRG